MDNVIRKETEALRERAMNALRLTSEYSHVKALDDAVHNMGGERILPPAPGVMVRFRARPAPEQIEQHRRLSQGDATFAVLTESGEPTGVKELVELVAARGVRVGGEDKETNLSSTLSKDRRFVSIRDDDGKYLWWLKGAMVPQTKEAAELDLAGEPAASMNADQKGGSDGTDIAS